MAEVEPAEQDSCLVEVGKEDFRTPPELVERVVVEGLGPITIILLEEGVLEPPVKTVLVPMTQVLVVLLMVIHKSFQ